MPGKHLLFVALAAMLASGCNNPTTETPANNGTATSQPDDRIPIAIPYSIVNVYPHDPTAFTEGLEYHEGFLYESTGRYGRSDLRKVELKTGKVVRSQKMEPQYFGEGLTLLDNKIYQLTYREGKCFVYGLETWKQERVLPVSTQEAWGMCNNGTHLLFDDGTNLIHFIDPKTNTEVKTLKVTDEHGPVQELNELELINGYLYANLWRTETILKIDTSTGYVVGRADLTGLRESQGILRAGGDPNGPDVLNGIAYDATGNRIFVTGKNWPKMIEIKLDN